MIPLDDASRGSTKISKIASYEHHISLASPSSRGTCRPRTNVRHAQNEGGSSALSLLHERERIEPSSASWIPIRRSGASSSGDYMTLWWGPHRARRAAEASTGPGRRRWSLGVQPVPASGLDDYRGSRGIADDPCSKDIDRAGTAPYFAAVARAERVDMFDLAENGASKASFLYQLGPFDAPVERRVDRDERW
jgi:hypothetical protein